VQMFLSKNVIFEVLISKIENGGLNLRKEQFVSKSMCKKLCVVKI